jgi:hypothetical protein
MLSKHRLPAIQIMWGGHLRAGKVASLEEADFVEIIVDRGTLSAAPVNQVEVVYVIGNDRNTIYVKKGTTVEELRKKLRLMHKEKSITGIASEGCRIADEDSVADWLQPTAGIPLEAMIPKMVQVIVDFRGVEKHFTIQETATEEEFKSLVRSFLSLGSTTQISVTPLGISSWEIRAGFTYWVAESRRMSTNAFDSSHRKTLLKIAGNLTLDEACEALRHKWNLPLWDVITLARAGSAPFWVEDKRDY